MKKSILFLFACAAFFFAALPQQAHAQIAVQIGSAPECPYGYFDYPPYECAPYGYYGPEWFTGGVFIGAGPWFHGDRRFRGHVDNHFDRNDGWHGEYPRRGEHWAPERGEHGRVQNFHGNEMRDGRGHSNLGAAHSHGGEEHGHH